MALSILRISCVIQRTGLSKSTIYSRISEGSFPSPISLGGRSVGWIENEIDQWIGNRISLSRNTISLVK